MGHEIGVHALSWKDSRIENKYFIMPFFGMIFLKFLIQREFIVFMTFVQERWCQYSKTKYANY